MKKKVYIKRVLQPEGGCEGCYFLNETPPYCTRHLYLFEYDLFRKICTGPSRIFVEVKTKRIKNFLRGKR